MVFGRHKINCDVDIKINTNHITRVNKKKFLGIMIDEQLNWKEQIHRVQTGLSRITGVMYRASHVSGTASLLTLYHSLFLPIYNGLLLRTLGKCMCHQLICTVSQCYKKRQTSIWC